MIADVALDYMLALGLASFLVVGYLLGSEHTALLTRMVAVRVRIIRRQRRQVARARGERALALAQRDDALRQLALADAALAEATHPVQHTGDLPEQDPAMDALMRVVTGDEPVDEVPHGAHHRPDHTDTWLWGERP
jgi:hypothetical protein